MIFVNYFFIENLRNSHLLGAKINIFKKRDLKMLNLDTVTTHLFCINFNTQFTSSFFLKYSTFSISLHKKKFIFLNVNIFYKNFKKLFFLLYIFLKKGFFFFVFSYFNVMMHFFNLLKYSTNFFHQGEFNFLFNLKLKRLGSSNILNILNVLSDNYKVCSLIFLNKSFTKLNLNLFRGTNFVQIGLVCFNASVPFYDYYCYFNKLSIGTIFNISNLFISLYFSAFFELKFTYLNLYSYYYNKLVFNKY